MRINFLFYFCPQKEIDNRNVQKRKERVEEPEQNCVPDKPGAFQFSDNTRSTKNPDPLAEQRPQTNKCVSRALGEVGPSNPSSVKRTFSDVQISPESLENQTKKSTVHYRRCCKIPEVTARFHTGLTRTLSTIELGDFLASTEGVGSDRDQVPKRSSPIVVAKSLFSELEEPTEEMFDVVSNSSFTSPLAETSDICRSLSLDSDGSMHETSLTVDERASFRPSRFSRERESQSSEEQEENKDSSMTESLPVTLSAVATETPKLGRFVLGGEHKSSFLNRPPDLACGAAQSPSFLKPRNVVAFRSYCSSINRSNMSGVSRLSIGSVEHMDVSTAASCHSESSTATPVQKRRTCSSSFQVKYSGSQPAVTNQLSLLSVSNSLPPSDSSAHVHLPHPLQDS